MVATKKYLGQHWLYDKDILGMVAQSANLHPEDTVLEIGPGQGDLTRILAAQTKLVVACEVDTELIPQLQAGVPRNVSIIAADILMFDLTSLPTNYKVVANIPYFITAKIIQTLLTADNPPGLSVLLIQKEVAQRLVSSKRSVLSISAEVFTEASIGIEVPAHYFTPPPNVDSQVIILKRRPQALVPALLQKQFFQVVKAGFSEKRKKLRSSLAGGLQLEKTEVENLLTAATIPISARAEELSVADWKKLVTLIYKQ